MRRSVSVAMASASRSGSSPAAVACQARSSSSMETACGNFGAGLKPPKSASKPAARFARARSMGSRLREMRFLRDGRHEVIEHAAQRGILAAHAATLVAIEVRNALDQVRERRHSVARLLREVSAAKERCEVIRREEHREWPAAASLRQHLVRDLVYLVEIGPFLAIHLDVDEQPVHDGGSRIVLEGLVRHHMAPVTG